MVSLVYQPENRATFIQQALQWAAGFDCVCYLDSNGYQDPYGSIDALLAVGAKISFTSNGENTFERLQEFLDSHPDSWIPGFLGYDLKNEIEGLESRHPNTTGFPDAFFFVPEQLLLIGRQHVTVRANDPDLIYRQILNTGVTDTSLNFKGKLKHRMNRQAYFEAFAHLQQHIQQGDIYEVNLCQEFYSENTTLHPLEAYRRLNAVSPTPFSCFLKCGQQYVLSASPERFLAKNGSTLLSQPIKGTAPRSKNISEDERIKTSLQANPKEISENIMIVDLVRNDLTRSAKRGTVKATELLAVHSFKQVHQLVSTITCELDNNLLPTTAIRNTFPPGSMTGAPKISAMKLIDRYEHSRRGIYAGAIGYFSPMGDFDFNVVIRTLVYNAENGYLSFHTGGAITAGADAEKEYNECLLKGQALFEVLNSQ